MSEDLEQSKNEGEKFVAPETGNPEDSGEGSGWKKYYTEPVDESLKSQDKLAEKLSNAEQKGERIIEIPVQLSYTVKIPESMIIGGLNTTETGNIVYDQTNDIQPKIRNIIKNELNNNHPELIEDAIKRHEALSEIRNTRENIDKERIKELIQTAKDINHKYKIEDNEKSPDQSVYWSTRHVKEIVDKME